MTVRRDGSGRNAQWQAWVPPEPTPTERRLKASWPAWLWAERVRRGDAK